MNEVVVLYRNGASGGWSCETARDRATAEIRAESHRRDGLEVLVVDPGAPSTADHLERIIGDLEARAAAADSQPHPGSTALRRTETRARLSGRASAFREAARRLRLVLLTVRNPATAQETPHVVPQSDSRHAGAGAGAPTLAGREQA